MRRMLVDPSYADQMTHKLVGVARPLYRPGNNSVRPLADVAAWRVVDGPVPQKVKQTNRLASIDRQTGHQIERLWVSQSFALHCCLRSFLIGSANSLQRSKDDRSPMGYCVGASQHKY